MLNTTPFLRQINRMSHPNPVIRQLNPTRGTGINNGITGVPRVGLTSINHKAGGGIVHFDDGGYADMGNAVDDGDIGAMPGDWSGSGNPSVDQSASSPDLSANLPPLSTQSVYGSNPLGTPKMSSGLQGWLQNTHGGFKGSDIVKAALTALTGALSGASNRKAQSRTASALAKGNPQLAPTIPQIGVPLAYSAGGRISMKSAQEPKVWMSQGGYIVRMKSPDEPKVWMANGGTPPASDAGSAPGGQVDPQSPQGQQIVQAALMAVMSGGQDPQSQAAIQAFVQAFGQEALQALIQQAQQASAVGQQGGGITAQPTQQQPPPGAPAMAGGGMLNGPGDGMSDSIPANNGNVRVANQEYVVPADVVSSVGNGSSSAGAKKLDAAIAHIRKMKYGRSKQPPKISDTQNPVTNTLKS